MCVNPCINVCESVYKCICKDVISIYMSIYLFIYLSVYPCVDLLIDTEKTVNSFLATIDVKVSKSTRQDDHDKIFELIGSTVGMCVDEYTCTYIYSHIYIMYAYTYICKLKHVYTYI